MRALFATLMLASLCALGCGDDVGTCSDENKARDPVLSGNVVMFGGQAIVNKSCAGGRCHSSQAKGALRDGAPAGLDFDLVPVSEADADGDEVNDDGDPYVALKPSQLAALRTRQQTVHDRRDAIWELVQDFRMPPPTKEFSSFRALGQILTVSNDAPCEKGKAYKSLLTGESQEVLRNWLACGAPIVESNGSVVAKAETAGQAGWQYPMCEAAGGDGGVVSLATLLEGPFSSCTTCHPGSGTPDFTTTAKAVQTVVGKSDEACDGKPFVTKGDPEQSYLYDLVSKDDPGCGQLRMPLAGPPLSESELAQVAAWITAGAPTTDADIETSNQSSDPSAP